MSFLSILIIHSSACAQKSTISRSPLSFSLNYFFDGRSLKFGNQHPRTFLYHNPYCLELLISRVPIGKRGWEKYWRFPKIGVSISVTDYNRHTKPEDLGYSLAIIPFFHGYLFRSQRLSAHYGVGFGFAYHTAIYDRKTNIDNNAISTNFTAAFSNDWKLTYVMSPHVSLHALFSIRHFSNGAIRIPNAGMNVLLWGLGVTYQPKYVPAPVEADTTWNFKTRIRYHIEFGYNKKGVAEGDFANYDIFTLGIYANKMLTKINALGGGIDLTYDNSIYPDAMRFENFRYQEKTPYTNYLVTAYIANEFYVGTKCSYTTTLGWHLYQEYNIYGKFLHRHTLKWFFTDYLYLKGALKVFSFAADSFDIGLGLRI